MLQKAVTEILDNSVLPETKIFIALDDDDETAAVAGQWRDDPRIVLSIAPREDALGAKYNRAAGISTADIYLMWSNDVSILTKGWDQRLTQAAELFPDGMGVVYFGHVLGALQPGIAVTA